MRAVNSRSNLLPSREKVDRATLRETDAGVVVTARTVANFDARGFYHPRIRQPSAATFAREGRRLSFGFLSNALNYAR